MSDVEEEDDDDHHHHNHNHNHNHNNDEAEQEQHEQHEQHEWTREQDLKILLFWQSNNGWEAGISSATLMQHQPDFAGIVTEEQIDGRFDELYNRLVDESNKDPTLLKGY